MWTESELRGHVDAYIERVVTAVDSGGSLGALAQAGSRHRSFLVYVLAHRTTALEDAAAVAAAVELLHLGTLVHDDIVDGASLRRHQPSLHVTVGVPAAIWLADALFAEAVHLAGAVTPLGGRVVATALSRVARSQVLESKHPSLDRYWEVVDGKTGALFEACAELVDEPADGTLGRGTHDAARAYGRLFQYVDDLQDIVGTGALGKPVGADEANLVATLPAHDLAESASAVRERIDRLSADVLDPLGDDDHRAGFESAVQRIVAPVLARLDDVPAR